jgi:hypothetical protein
MPLFSLFFLISIEFLRLSHAPFLLLFDSSSVPMNVDYVFHRYGEWTMLMLGESVLSLLVVDIVASSGYYEEFICGIISIVLLEYLHFQSQPSDPNEHAIRRGMSSSFAFYWLMQVYSMSLIILGSSYKMLLYQFVYIESAGSHRSLLFPGLDERLLSGGVSAALRFTNEERQVRIANLFSGSLFLIFLCLDAMSLAHRGLNANWKRCERAETRTKKFLAYFLIVCRIALIVFTASLSQFDTDPRQVGIIGMFTILAQLILRLVGYFVFHANEEDEKDKAIDRIINYNTARIHDRATHPMNNSQ